MIYCPNSRLGAIGRIDLFQDSTQMYFYRRVADAKAVGDRFVGFALDDQTQDFVFPARKRFVA